MTDTTLSASEVAIRQQEPSNLGTRRRPGAGDTALAGANDTAPLYAYYWPPVHPFAGFDEPLAKFMAATPAEQDELLAGLRTDPEAYGEFLHVNLAELYAHWFGYRDGAFTRHTDDAAELSMYQAKLRLERELFDHWVTAEQSPEFADQHAAADYLDEIAATNPGVGHPLFEYLATEATPEQLARFLQCELIRNEVVDDEVALLVVGLQGMQKAVAAANLWDECGRGKLENFHTYWLRRLLEATDGWEKLYDFRHGHPWFAKFTSNMNAAMLTRPSRKMMAYGTFLVFESWVEPHFVKILEGLTRIGVLDDDIRLYFTAHVKIDPRHSRELSDGLREQRPELDQQQIADVVRGAELAATTGKRQFDMMLDYLKSLPVTAVAGAPA